MPQFRGLNLIMWVHNFREMSYVVLVDSKGRVTLPRDVRRSLGVKPGDRFRITVVGSRIVLEKAEDPFEVLNRILKDVRFDRKAREKAEEERRRFQWL